MAILVPCLDELRDEFNVLSPQRDKTTDGWIGDSAHASGSSDHNDDEKGNVPIRDADNVSEVHAIDVDKDLIVITMAAVVAHILSRCRSGKEKRLRYIIFNGVIWSASSGWVAKTYTGSNKHDKHAHFSASYTTAHEADRSSWGVATLAGGSSITMFCKQGEKNEQTQAVQYKLQLLGLYDGVLDGDYGPKTTAAVKAARAKVGSVQDGTVYDAHAHVQIDLVWDRHWAKEGDDALIKRIIDLEKKVAAIPAQSTTPPADDNQLAFPLEVTITGTINRKV